MYVCCWRDNIIRKKSAALLYFYKLNSTRFEQVLLVDVANTSLACRVSLSPRKVIRAEPKNKTKRFQGALCGP